MDENVQKLQEEVQSLKSDLKKEKSKNESLSERVVSLESRPATSGGSGSGGGSGHSGNGPELVKKRSFDQLVKEVDQCFAELGRQVQREAKHRQNIETQLHNLETNGPEVSSRDHGFDPDVDRRLSRCENLAQEVKKDLRKEKKRFEKIQSQTEAQMKNQIDQKTIEVGAKYVTRFGSPSQ